MMKSLLLWLTRICCGIIVRREIPRLPEKEGCVFFANHTTHFDLLVILSALPKPVRKNLRPVAAKEYWLKTALRRWLALRVLNIIPIDRQNPSRTRSCFQEIHDTLEQGNPVLIFPEGGRQSPESGGNLKGGIFLIAEQRPETRFYPVRLSGFHRVLPKGEWLPAPNMGIVSFREPIVRQPEEPRAAFMERCRRALEREDHA